MEIPNMEMPSFNWDGVLISFHIPSCGQQDLMSFERTYKTCSAVVYKFVHNAWGAQFFVTFSTLCHIMPSSKGNIFRVTGHLWGEFIGHRWFPRTKASFDVFFDLRLNKRLSKQSWGWWFETPSRSLWRHCNEMSKTHLTTGGTWSDPGSSFFCHISSNLGSLYSTTDWYIVFHTSDNDR